MPSSRSLGNELNRLLGAAAGPVYVLDGERRIVYCNPACAAWLELPAESIVGQTCAYHSSPSVDPLVGRLAALCPPPEVFTGQRISTTIARGGDGLAPSLRRAEFVPIAVSASAEESSSVLAMIGAADLPAESGSAALANGAGHSLRGGVGEPCDESTRHHQRLQALHHELRRTASLDRLLGDSPAMVRVRAQVRLAAAGDATVLVVGAPGSGRQYVAKSIYYARPREQLGTLLPLSCQELGAELLQSTIAAWLGRQATDRAPPATLLLSDVDQLPLEVQAELAAGFGSTPPLRIVATAAAPLDELAARGEFRADLACALSTMVIRLPVLKERLEDIPLLAQMFLEELNAAARGGAKQLRGFSPETLDQLAEYDWPGNIDELGAIVREAYAKAEGAQISPGDLPRRIYLATAAGRHPRRLPEPIPLEEFLAKVEGELIARAMRLAKGNKTKAARLLGLTRPRLYRRMVQLGLEK